jgi:S1-C subfamily serine protease
MASKSASGFVAASEKIEDLRAAKNEWAARLVHRKAGATRTRAAAASAAPSDNVVGVGIGEKLSGGAETGIMAVKFLVRKKYPEGQMAAKQALPASLAGLPTDVEEVGELRAFRRGSARASAETAMPDPKTRIRPAQPGCSVGFADPANQFVMAGTFGALVKNKSGVYILSNNHVLADENQLPAGSPIYQPGLLDGGQVPTDQIAKLKRAVRLRAGVANKVDAAIATVLKTSLVSNEVLHIGAPTGKKKAEIGMEVHKFGRTTSYTAGRVTSIETDVSVSYETGTFTFADQMIIVGLSGSFSAAGDSGSLILERSTQKAVGLLFAGSSTHTIANHIAKVLSALRVSLA